MEYHSFHFRMHKRGAACIVGQIRTLIYPSVQENLKNVLQLLQLHLFLHVSTQVSTVWYSNATNPLSVTSKKDIDHILSHLNPEFVKIQPDNDLNLHNISKSFFHRPLAMREQTCFKAIVNFEVKQNRRFQYILLARPDLIYSCLPPVLHLKTPWAIVNQDFFIFLSRSIAPFIFNAPDTNIRTCNVHSPKYTVFREEWCKPCTLWKHLGSSISMFAMRLQPFLPSRGPCKLSNLTQRTCYKPIEIQRPYRTESASTYIYGSWKLKQSESIHIPINLTETCPIYPACMENIIWNPPCRATQSSACQ